METFTFLSGRTMTGIIKNKPVDLPRTANIQFCELLVDEYGNITDNIDVYLHATKKNAKFYFIINPF